MEISNDNDTTTNNNNNNYYYGDSNNNNDNNKNSNKSNDKENIYTKKKKKKKKNHNEILSVFSYYGFLLAWNLQPMKPHHYVVNAHHYKRRQCEWAYNSITDTFLIPI